MDYKISSFLHFLLLMVASFAVFGRADSVIIVQKPVALNDTITVILPYSDTLFNVTANDYSPSGNSFCLSSVYGSPLFTISNCSSVDFHSDSNLLRRDTAWYVICNIAEPDLCDTGMIVVNVVEHYIPFMLNDSKWVYYTPSCNCDDCGGSTESWLYYWTDAAQYDTIINDKSYKKLYTEEFDINYDCVNNVTSYDTFISFIQNFIRQDTLTQQVFLLSSWPANSNEKLIYNFSLSLNDTIISDSGYTSWVTSFSYFESGGTYYRIISFENATGYGYAWTEGFGGGRSPFGLYNNYPDQFFSLLCFSNEGATIYPTYSTDSSCVYLPLSIETVTENNLAIYPNPSSNYCTLKLNSNGNLFSASLIDITGREVMPLFNNQRISTFNFNISPLAAGIYFVKVSDETGGVVVKKLVKE